jgi:hypothetical protein
LNRSTIPENNSNKFINSNSRDHNNNNNSSQEQVETNLKWAGDEFFVLAINF